MRKITYVANIRMPTERAHGVQVMKACEAFAKKGALEKLIVTDRPTPIKGDPFSYFGIQGSFALERAHAISTAKNPLSYLLQRVLFAVSARARIPKDTVIYTRDEVVAWVLGHLTAQPLVWESHDGAWNMFARYVARRSQLIVVVTEFAREFYAKKGVPVQKIHATPNGIDLEAFAKPEDKDSARKRLGLPEGVPVAMYIGALGGWKGTDTLLEASKYVSGVTVAVIGGSAQEIATLAARYPQVRFLGSRPYAELADNQAAADILVVPNTGKDPVSVGFTSPLKLLAHMASGVPIVASDLPSLRELVGGEAALLVPPDDPQGLARGIQSVLDDPAHAKAIAASALRKAASYSWSTRAERILKRIEEW
jgi:glycosyltransferase involved in cell wall biosynthesis